MTDSLNAIYVVPYTAACDQFKYVVGSQIYLGQLTSTSGSTKRVTLDIESGQDFNGPQPLSTLQHPYDGRNGNPLENIPYALTSAGQGITTQAAYAAACQLPGPTFAPTPAPSPVTPAPHAGAAAGHAGPHAGADDDACGATLGNNNGALIGAVRTAASPCACRTLCLAESLCVAWTYDVGEEFPPAHPQSCYLRSTVGSFVQCSHCLTDTSPLISQAPSMSPSTAPSMSPTFDRRAARRPATTTAL